MKLHRAILIAAVAATLALCGCGSKVAVNTAPLQKSFQTAETSAKEDADKAISAIESADYAGAVTQLQQLAKNAKLTPEQQQAVKDMIEKVQKVIADAAGKASGEASKAVGDLQKSLPK
jgi:outer membrane protein assembly factor BamD (BamD/ComL family)